MPFVALHCHHFLSSAFLWMCLICIYPGVAARSDNSKDADEIAMAIFRLQDTYELTAAEILSNTIPDFEFSSALDCFHIAMVAFRRSDFYHALIWLQEAQIRLGNETESSLTLLELWGPLAIALNRQGNPYHAFVIGKKLEEALSRMPESERISVLRGTSGLQEFMSGLKNGENAYGEIDQIRNDRSIDEKTAVYEEMCRTGWTNPQLWCSYKRDTPYLRLAPAKMELLHIDPVMVLFRGIISDTEIRIIQSLARDKLSRGKVFHGKERTTSEVRTSSMTWVYKKEHPLISQLHRRISDYTGLDIREIGDPLQVARYEFGGHYFLHYDHMTERQRAKHGYHGSYNAVTGDRLATLMFYLTDPGGGGSTVFPYLSLSISPSKNDAVFWYNLRKDGSGYHEVLHGGCPVVSGTKWVANQWIRERGQEFTRPCGLREDEQDVF